MKFAAFGRDAGGARPRTFRGVDELNVIAVDLNCSVAFGVRERHVSDPDLEEYGRDDPDLTGGIERNDAQNAPNGLGLPIQRGVLVIGNLAFDATTVASLASRQCR